MNVIHVAEREFAPSKIVCVGRNYYAHIEELHNEVPSEIVFFVKPNSAISEQLKAFHQEQLHYEGELCLLVENNSFSALGFGLDLTKRNLQTELKQKGLPWERAKSFDGAAVFSKFVEISEFPQNLEFQLSINDKPVQNGNLELMIHKPTEILSELRTFMSLNDGDIIMTGTPKGVGSINAGDRFSATVSSGRKVLISDAWIAQ
jgi:2-keto-4-pentenoate hydratase/2-oxohepta-3-ene-1,7-dioic acid hydratase in catechol pathway